MKLKRNCRVLGNMDEDNSKGGNRLSKDDLLTCMINKQVFIKQFNIQRKRNDVDD